MRRLLYIILLFLASYPLLPNNIQLSFEQRRRYDQIHLEIWAKGDISLNPIKQARFAFSYDTSSIFAVDDFINDTDSLLGDMNVTDPVADITSEFHNRNGYTSAEIEFDTNRVFVTINKTSLQLDGENFYESGKGSFIGSIPFQIKDSVDTNAITGIRWFVDSTYVTDTDDEDISSYITYQNQDSFKVLGVKILFPAEAGTLLDRDYNYPFLTGSYRNKGFPVFYERTIDPAFYEIPETLPPAIDNNLAYQLSYLNKDSTETEIGRFVESDIPGSKTSNNSLYHTGEIGNPGTISTFVTTSLKGGMIDRNNFRLPVRFLIEYDEDYPERLENLKLKLTQLNGEFGTDLDEFEETEISDIQNGPFAMGRIFFLQFNGQDEYLKTQNNISNSTQLTVEAWINLNAIRDGNSEPGIVASSAGDEATPIMGSKEGAWMLYLKDGKYPAFRVREIEGRGNKGYLAEVAAHYPIDSVAKDNYTTHKFSRNWNYISATVHNNQVKLYVNGELVDSYTNTFALDARMLTTIHPVWIGINPNDGIDGNDYLPAAVKGVRVWRLALSQEEIRRNASKVLEPDNIGDFEGIRRGLQLYYELAGNLEDLADNQEYQNGKEILNYVSDNNDKNYVSFRPDYPHLKLTSPAGNEGFLNTQGHKYEFRWISYEVGNTERDNSKDVQFEYSTDNGKTWTIANDTLGRMLGGSRSPDTEATKVYWEPFENDNFEANLRSITPYAKNLRLKISGTNYFEQEDIFYISDKFLVAPYFSLQKTAEFDMIMPGDVGMNLSAQENMLECWVRPYRFPSEEEGAFSIIEKIDTQSNVIHYALRLLPEGNLEFSVLDNKGIIRTVQSDPNKPLIRPNSVQLDSVWTHIAVYFDKNYNDSSYVLFMIDGNPQFEDEYVFGLGGTFETNYANDFPTYICSYTGNENRISVGMEGEIKELRFWNGRPNGITDIDTLVNFVQAAQSVRADELLEDYKKNLYAVFNLNGGSFHNNGMNRSVAANDKPEIYFRYYNTDPKFVPVKPYIKLVEPSFKQKVENENTNLRLRWVGFDYEGDYFPEGSSNSPPFIEFSLLGGGGNQTQPYQYVGSGFWPGNKIQSLQVPDSSVFKFNGTGEEIAFAAVLDVSNTDPDINNDGSYNDQGPLSATLTNARLKLWSRYRVFNSIENISSEGPLFSVIPATNFNVRLLLEGYHNGSNSGDTTNQLGKTYETGGIRIYLYENNGGIPGELIDSSDSFLGYSNQNPFNLDANENNFANIEFVFPNLDDGEYWLVVDHRNHLPVMSRYPVKFKYEGDDKKTWQIESGWDFTSWNGESGNVLPSSSITPWINGYYTAYGFASNDNNTDDYLSTALVYNNGIAGDTTNALPAMTGGDVYKDGIIDNNDAQIVRSDEATVNYQSDVTGDGYINADDRVIVDRNIGKVSSLNQIEVPKIFTNSNNISKKIYKTLKNDKFQAFYNINLKTITTFEDKKLKIDVYIENLGDDFNLGSATFAFMYDTSAMNYSKIILNEDVPWDDTTAGYKQIRSAPNNENGAISGLRTIEIDYDVLSGKQGATVNSGDNYIASLEFNVISEDVLNLTWHPSTTVHTTDNKILNDNSTKEEFEPIFQYEFALTEPNGGEEYRPGIPLSITWDCNSNPLIYLEFSSNNGATWTQISPDSVNADSLKYVWTVSNSKSQLCFIRAIDYKSGLEIDRSDKAFKIIDGFAQIIRPSSGDAVYRGGESSKILWTSQGYSQIRFEYSIDGGTTWKGVSGVYNATSGEANWRLPKETTKNALVRMIDMITGAEAARSSVFRILNGELEFQLPRENQTIFIDRYTKIRWFANNVDEFDIMLSTDAGNSWKILFEDVQGSTQSMNWYVEEPETDNAIIKAIWNGDEELEYARTGTFKIILYVSVYQEKEKDVTIAPNPASDYIEINLNRCTPLSKWSTSEIAIYDVLGNVVYSTKDTERSRSVGMDNGRSFSGYFDYAQQPLRIDISHLPSGVYFVRIGNRLEKFVKK